MIILKNLTEAGPFDALKKFSLRKFQKTKIAKIQTLKTPR